jgi:Flp pilus assembly protein TadG
VAAVEFALVVPVLLVLYMGTIEVSDLIAVDRRINVVAGTMGDLVARTDGCISNSTITDYFKASEGIIVPYSKTPLKQTVAFLTVTSAGVATVTWSQAYNGGTAKTVGQPYALPAAMVDISKGQWVVMSESYYAYKPLLGWVVSSAINLHRVSYYMPREGKTITYTSGTCS